jgi:hypothetical protein
MNVRQLCICRYILKKPSDNKKILLYTIKKDQKMCKSTSGQRMYATLPLV